MLNADQRELLQSFITIPEPTYAEIFALRAEVEELEEQIKVKTNEFEAMQDDLKATEKEKDEANNAVADLETALSDALSWIATDNGGKGHSEFAHENKEFARLYSFL